MPRARARATVTQVVPVSTQCLDRECQDSHWTEGPQYSMDGICLPLVVGAARLAEYGCTAQLAASFVRGKSERPGTSKPFSAPTGTDAVPPVTARRIS
jgi:hypothetical protein